MRNWPLRWKIAHYSAGLAVAATLGGAITTWFVMRHAEIAAFDRRLTTDAQEFFRDVEHFEGGRTNSGPVFKEGQAEKVIGPDRVGAPHAVYKIVAWQKPGERFTARGYVIRQDDTNTDLKAYLTKLDDIEAATGLDFFPDLDDVEEEELESTAFASMWGD